jgi:hypothetical protein
MPLFMVYITSAMTHLEGPVRHDSLFVLNTLIQYFPDLVAEHYNEVCIALYICCNTAVYPCCYLIGYWIQFCNGTYLALAGLYRVVIAVRTRQRPCQLQYY